MTKRPHSAPVVRSRQPWVTLATRDAIRHFAWGIGDDNPLWTNKEHADASRWAGRIAPPCFLYAIDETSVASGYPDHRRLYKAVDWTFYDVVREGTEISALIWPDDGQESDNEFVQSGQIEFHRPDEAILACAKTQCLRTKEITCSVEDRPEVRYSSAQLDAIERIILSERRRGTESRLWEQTVIGDKLGPLVKGPLSIMDVVAWSAGTTGVVPDASDHSEGGLHTQSATGPECVAWISQLITDWMGDDAFLHQLKVDIETCPLLGSTTTITGRVKDTSLRNRAPEATIEVSAEDQDHRIVATGTARLLLPSSEYGPVSLPLAVENL